MIRIPGDPVLEGRLNQEANRRLRERKRAIKDYSHLWEKNLKKGVKKLGTADRLAFEVLHRQFRGFSVPGFATAVYAGRFVWTRLGKIRGRA